MRVFDLMNLELKLKIYFISSDKNLVTLFHKLTKATSMGRFYLIQWRGYTIDSHKVVFLWRAHSPR